jgi:hypothetical protein
VDYTLNSGGYTSTLTSDNSHEVLAEVMNGTSYSWKQPKWKLNAWAGSAIQLRVEPYYPTDTDSDNSQFAYSTDGTTYTNMVSITRTSGNNTDQTFSLPAGTSGSE